MADAMTSGSSRPKGQPVTIDYTDSEGLLWLSINNFLLNLVTLGIHRFWAKTQVRRHIWSNIKINGDALEYTGTGKELFLGAMLIFGLIGLPMIAALTAAQLVFTDSNMAEGLQLVIILGSLLLYGMAVYRARRYRLSRTLWRGIRASLPGSPISFSLLYFGAMLLKSITFGWSTPVMNLSIQQRMIGDMTFGNRTFLFGGPAGPLYSRFALCWIMTPVVIVAAVGLFSSFSDVTSWIGGLFDWTQSKTEFVNSSSWLVYIGLIFGGLLAIYVGYSVLWALYTVREMQIFASYTSFDQAQFHLDATVGSLIALWLGNVAIMIFTLTIGQPYAVQRMARYMCKRLRVTGTVDFNSIRQSTAVLDKRGEGLADAFDIDPF